MTKAMLIKLIQKSREDALVELNRQYHEAMLDHKLQLAYESGMVDHIERIQSLVDAAYEEYLEMRKDLTQFDGVCLSSCYTSIHHMLKDMAGRSVLQIIFSVDLADESPEAKAILELNRDVKVAINDNYRALEQNVRNIKKLDEAVAYVNSLGFELPEYAAKSTTAIMSPVDTRYLFTKNN